MKLTPPQVELLTDIATHDQMYINMWMRWHRTAQALVSRGLARVVNPDAWHDPYEIRITPEGKAEAVSRGITC